MNCLPVEILWKIFSYIPAQERVFSIGEVCSYWYDIVISNNAFVDKVKFIIFLEDIGLTKKNESRKLDFYEISSSKFWFVPFVKSVKVTTEDMQIFRFNGIQCVLTKYFRNIKELEFSNVHAIPSSFFTSVFRTLQNLEVFKINRCYFTNVEVFLQIRHLKHLTKFELLNGFYFCDRHLDLLAEECPSLAHVWIPDSRAVSNSSLVNFLKIKRSSLIGLGINGYQITDVAYTRLSECKNLVTFYVEDARKITEKGIKVLLKLPKLESLTLKYITLNVDDNIISLIQSFLAKKKTLVWKEF